ncbi:MAG: SCO family protein [Bradyrhizobiaceae bacterium]|nr:SCO family protein [Hyphomicrobiales bacterium]MBV9427440.1 SCO family protein [Bradyrhizobiaceae bacterium]
MRRAARALIGTIVVLAGAVSLALLASFLSPGSALAASDVEDLAFRPHPGDRLPLGTAFTDEHGRSVALRDYFDKVPVILVLEYLRCTSLCGVTLQNLVEALARVPLELGHDYRLVAVSIDPRDKPAEAAAARDKYADLLGPQGAASSMHFLTTSSTAAVRAVADAVGFPYRYDGWLDAYLHPAGFVIVAPDGAISRYVEGIAISPQELVAALADAKQNNPQGPLSRLLILCRVQGIALGRLTVPVLGAFTLANIVGGCVLIAIFTVVWRRRHS